MAVATAVGVAVAAATTEEVGGRGNRPPLGTGVQADPTSHQHKRPVRSNVAAVCCCVFGARSGVGGAAVWVCLDAGGCSGSRGFCGCARASVRVSCDFVAVLLSR